MKQDTINAFQGILEAARAKAENKTTFNSSDEAKVVKPVTQAKRNTPPAASLSQQLRKVNQQLSQPEAPKQPTQATGQTFAMPMQFVNFKTQQQQPAPQPASPALEIFDYSLKAFAVISKDKDKLKAIQNDMYNLGGSYNHFLKCGPGYIFSKKRIDSVKAYLKTA